MTTINSIWNTGSGSWFTAANWDEPNPNPPFTPPLHYVPGPDSGSTIYDINLSNINNVANFTVTYNGTDIVDRINSAALLDMTGGSLRLEGSLGNSVTAGVNVANGATLTVDSNALIAQSGNFAGTVAGAGTLFFDDGTFNINAGASLTIAHWTISGDLSGSTATVNINTDFTYNNAFTAVDVSGNSPTTKLNGHTLTLTSNNVTLDGIFSGPGTLKITGSAVEPGGQFGSNTMIGGATLEVAAGATITQTNNLNLGDGSTNGTLKIDAGAHYTINSSSIAGNTSPTHAIVNNAGVLRVTGASSNASLNAQFTNSGTVTIDVGDSLALGFGGANTLGGTINGAGKLVIGAGTTALNTTNVTVNTLALAGGNGGATLTLGVDLSYAGTFEFDNSFDTLDLNGHTLTLTSASSTLHGNVIDGAGTLKLTGTADIGGNINVGGPNGVGTPATIEDAGTMKQSGGVGLNGTLLIDASHSYTITAASTLSSLGAGATITNNGTFADTGSGISSVSGKFTSTGTLSVGSGATLVLGGGTQTLGGSISGAGELVFGFGANATINTGNVTVAKLALAGGNGGALVKLGTNLSYAHTFEFDSSFDTLDLNGHTLTLTSATNTLHGNVIDGAGTLKVTGTADIGGNINVGGPNGVGTPATIEDAGTMKQSGGVGLNGTLLIDAAHTYTITTASNLTGAGAGATITNNGTFADSAAGSSTVSGKFTSTGALSVGSGATLFLNSGADTLGGSISGAGALGFGFGVNATLTTSAVTVSKIVLNGGLGGATLALGTNLTYAGTLEFDGAFDRLDLSGHTLTLTGAGNTLHNNVIDSGGTLKIGGKADIGDNISIGQAAPVTIDDAGTINHVGNLSLHGTLQIDTGAFYNMSNDAHLFDNGAATTNAGKIEVLSGASQLDGSLANTGTVLVDAGASLRVTGTVSGAAGSFQVGSNAVLELGGTVPAGQTVHFTGADSLLRADVPAQFAAHITGFIHGDALDLGGEVVTGLSYNGSVVTVNLQGGGTQHFNLTGTFDTLITASDNNGGTEIIAVVGNTVETTLSNYTLGSGIANVIFTDNGPHTANGNALNNVITGGSGVDTFFGNGGSDTLNGGGGNDTLVGNDDPFASVHDTLNGGDGNDMLLGEPSDTINGGAGSDSLQAVNSNPWTINLGTTSIETMLAGFGDDHVDASTQTVGVTVFGQGGNDTVTGSAHDDFLWGGVGNDTLTGGAGNDLLFGDLGADSLSGGAGNDTIYADSSDTLIDGGLGTDALYWAAGVGANINLAADSIEFVQTLGDNDTLNGSASTSAVTVFAGAGNDTVSGGSGKDFLWGEAGNDILVGNGDNDTLVGGLGADRLTGGPGTDNLYGNSGGGGDGAADTFIFTANWGTDFVYDFDDGTDKLDMTALHINFASLTITSSNGNADVDFGANHIVVVGQAGHIAQSDFLF